MIPPYSQLTLLDSLGSSRVQTVCATEYYLFIGTVDGQILSYKLIYEDITDEEESDLENDGKKVIKQVIKSVEFYKKNSLGYGKKPITDMQVILDLDILITLCDGHINVFSMHAVEKVMPSFQPKDTQGFCIDKKNPHRILVRYKKDFMIYVYRPNLGVFDHDHRHPLAPELVKPLSVEWYDNTLYLGLKKSYVMADIRKASEYHELLSHKESEPLVKFLPPNMILLRQQTQATLIPVQTSESSSSKLSATAAPPPPPPPPTSGFSITPINVASTVFYTTTNFFTATLSTIPTITGTSSSSTPPPPSLTALMKTLPWPAGGPSPQLLSFEFPFLLSVHNTNLSVQNILTQERVQQLQFQNSNIVAMELLVREIDGGIPGVIDSSSSSVSGGGKKFGRVAVVATASRIHLLTPISIELQVQKMFEDGQVNEGVDFFRSVYSNSERDVFEQKLKRVYAKAGIASFCSLHFENAFLYFEKSDINCCEIISFFDNILPPQLNYKPRFHSHKNFKEILLKAKKLSSTSTIPSPNLSLTPTSNSVSTPNLNLGAQNPRSSSQEEAFSIRYYQTAVTMLIDFLCKKRTPMKKSDEQIGIDTALAKFWADLGKWEKLYVLLSNLNNVSSNDTESYFEQKGYTYALGCLAKSIKDEKRALELWNKLATNSLFGSDQSEPNGVRDSISLLSSTSNIDLIWIYSPTLFKKVGSDALKIFIENGHPELDPETVLRFLESLDLPSSSSATSFTLQQMYLEHLVSQPSPPREEFFTQLGMMYIDTIITLLSNSTSESQIPGTEIGILGTTRKKFIEFLRTHNLYNSAAFLARIGDSRLFPECVFLNRKLGKHENALSILINQLNDYNGAEEYCLSYRYITPITSESVTSVSSSSGTGLEESRKPKQPFVIKSPNILFSVNSPESITPQRPISRVRMENQTISKGGSRILQRRDRKITTNEPSSFRSTSEETQVADVSELLFTMFKILMFSHIEKNPGHLSPLALKLLETHSDSMPITQVISILPEDIPISDISQFLTKSIQHKTHVLRDGQIVKNLYKFQYLKVSGLYTTVRSKSVMITKETECGVCRKYINDKVFATFPNGVVVHYKCYNPDDRHTDPVTKRNFKEFPMI